MSTGLPGSALTRWRRTFREERREPAVVALMRVIFVACLVTGVGVLGGWELAIGPSRSDDSVLIPALNNCIACGSGGGSGGGSHAVYFEETGLPSLATWGVLLTGGSVDSNESTITTQISFVVSSGTYSYLLYAPAGYEVASASPGSPLTVEASDVVVDVAFAPLTYTDSGSCAMTAIETPPGNPLPSPYQYGVGTPYFEATGSGPFEDFWPSPTVAALANPSGCGMNFIPVGSDAIGWMSSFSGESCEQSYVDECSIVGGAAQNVAQWTFQTLTSDQFAYEHASTRFGSLMATVTLYELNATTLTPPSPDIGQTGQGCAEYDSAGGTAGIGYFFYIDDATTGVAHWTPVTWLERSAGQCGPPDPSGAGSYYTSNEAYPPDIFPGVTVTLSAFNLFMVNGNDYNIGFDFVFNCTSFRSGPNIASDTTTSALSEVSAETLDLDELEYSY